MDLQDIRTGAPAAPQGGMVQQPAHKSSHRTVIVAVVVLLALLSLALWFIKSTKPATTYDDAGNPISHVKTGNLVAEFPRELLLEQDAVIENSYMIAYQNGAGNMPYAQYTSQKNFFENVSEYRRLLQAQGWVIQKDGDEEAVGGTNFYATKENAIANIVLTENQDKTVTVKVTYLTK